jgi:acetyl-CoA carboxylase biotin carboxyl carrier protein
VGDIKEVTTQLAELMDEFRLEEAKLEGDGWKVAFRKNRAPKGATMMVAGGSATPDPLTQDEPVSEAAVEARPVGTPVSSPMTGIFYSSPSPNAPMFVKEGESVTAGEVVGLIEAMKVFNEIHAPVSGIVDRVVAANGQLVNPGEPLIFIR